MPTSLTDIAQIVSLLFVLLTAVQSGMVLSYFRNTVDGNARVALIVVFAVVCMASLTTFTHGFFRYAAPDRLETLRAYSAVPWFLNALALFWLIRLCKGRGAP
jgi:membrane protein YdbS with pleckstrin-like domain